jgi:hypothetical protein
MFFLEAQSRSCIVSLTKNHPEQVHFTEFVSSHNPTLNQAIDYFTQNARLHGRSRKTIELMSTSSPSYPNTFPENYP